MWKISELMAYFMVKIATPILDGEFYYKEKEKNKA